MTHTAQHAAQDALTRRTAALDDLLTLPLGTLDRDDIDTAVRAAYALGNRLDAAKLRLVRAARHTDPDVPWDGRIGGLDGDRGSTTSSTGPTAAPPASRT